MSGNIFIVRANATSSKSLELLPENDNYDLIIDDADHAAMPQIARFELYFPERLAPGGYYVIEDILSNPQFAGHESVLQYFQKLSAHVQLRHSEIDPNSKHQGARVKKFRRDSTHWRDRVLWVLFQRNMIMMRKSWSHIGLSPQAVN